MIPLKELLAHVPQSGEVRWIGVRPASRAPMVEIDAVEARGGGQKNSEKNPPTPPPHHPNTQKNKENHRVKRNYTN